MSSSSSNEQLIKGKQLHKRTGLQPQHVERLPPLPLSSTAPSPVGTWTTVCGAKHWGLYHRNHSWNSCPYQQARERSESKLTIRGQPDYMSRDYSSTRTGFRSKNTDIGILRCHGWTRIYSHNTEKALHKMYGVTQTRRVPASSSCFKKHCTCLCSHWCCSVRN